MLIVAVVWKNHDLLADPHRVGVAYLRHSHGRCDTLELQERHIGGGNGRDDLRSHDLTGDAFDGDLVHAVDDVSGRHHPAAVGDQDTRARLVEAGDAASFDLTPLAPHDDDGRADLAEDVVQVLGPRRRGEGGQNGCREYHC